MKLILLAFSTLFLCYLVGYGQSNSWQVFTDSIATLSSPRACDLNNDGVKDLVYGGGTDGVFSNNGIMAINGATGNLLWKRASRNEVFGSAIFKDITGDGIKDVFMVGRQAQLLAINGQNGALLWDYFPYNTNPADSGLYNFYNPTFIQDVSGDGMDDILVANGGDHAAPAWDTTRPPGHLMVINVVTGSLLAKAVVPDSAETYCSAIVCDIQGNGTKWVLYGTGGETLGGSFWACPLQGLLNNSLGASIQLAHDPNFGFVAPASVYKTNGNQHNIFIQSYSGKLIKIKGSNLTQHWSYDLPNTESSAEPVIGNFTGNNHPDVFLFLAKGSSSAYTDYYQVLLDGSTGQEMFKDSIGSLQFASGNAVDLNNDGRDELVASINFMENGYWKHRLKTFDFQNNTIVDLVPTCTGVNIGSTPLFTDLDNDQQMDLVYLVKKDSLNPMGWKGVTAYRTELNAVFPNAGIAWGSYLSTMNDGEYHYTSVDCGAGSLINSVSVTAPWCNGTSSASITPTVNLGTAPYTYLWSNGSTSAQLSGIPAGTYSLQVNDAAGCYEIYTVVINDPYVISFGNILPPTCPGGNNGQAVLNSTGCVCMFSTCTFLWENGITTKPNYTLNEGWASVTITHPNGCVVVDSVLIPNSAPLVSQSLIQNVSCYGSGDGAITLLSPQALAPVTYSWNNGSTVDSISSLSPGNYVVVVSDSRPCVDTLSYVISEPNVLSFIVNTMPTLCDNEATGSLSISAIGGNGAYLYSVNNLNSSNNNFAGLAAGSYTINVVDSLGCTTTSQQAVITNPISLSLSFNVTPLSGVNQLDGTATVHVAGGTQPYQIQWSDPNQQTDSMAVYLAQGWITAFITDANGCSVLDSVYVGVLQLTEAMQSQFIAYPNPANQLLTFNRQSEKIYLYDARGSVVLTEDQASFIQVSHLAQGIYTLQLIENGTPICIRLVVLHE